MREAAPFDSAGREGPHRMARTASFIDLAKESASSFIADDALSRGASIAFYVVTSLVPVLVIVISIAGAVFGQDAARGAIAVQLSDVMGAEGAELLQSTIRGAADQSAGVLASVIGGVTLLVASSGVFGEMQSALNAIWREPPKRGTLVRILRGRLASLGLVVALGVMLLLSLTASAALTVPDAYINAHLPFGKMVLSALNFGIAFVLDALLFAAIYKILPDTDLEWHDVFVGAVATAFLFGVGKLLIGLYLRSSSITSTYGAAGGLIALLLWIYYSAQIFLLGAEFTKAYARREGSQQDRTDLIPSNVQVGPEARPGARAHEPVAAEDGRGA
jgi:membrane protein